MQINNIYANNLASAINNYSLAQTTKQITPISLENNSDSLEISSSAQKALKLQKEEEKLLKLRGLNDEEIIKFRKICQESKNSNTPKEFMKNLSIEDLDLLKRANSMADKITTNSIDKMSLEGAKNMLVAQDNHSFLDINNDGIVDHGLAKTFVFPPPNAPSEVKDAWDNVLDSLPENEKLLASSIFLTLDLQANTKISYDAQGNITNVEQLEGANRNNIFPSDFTSWFDLLKKADDQIDLNEKYATTQQQKDQNAKTRKLITSFRDELNKHQN